MMTVLYFAWLRARIGVGRETVEPPPGVADVAGLVAWLKTRSPRHAEALADCAVVKVAVNQEHVPYSHRVCAGDEVALFPPVTGG
jgi:molybdopterin synthase sulfur carrier subunit